MTHIAYRPKGENVEVEADFIVVGSGAGGAAGRAWRWRNSDRRRGWVKASRALPKQYVWHDARYV